MSPSEIYNKFELKKYFFIKISNPHIASKRTYLKYILNEPSLKIGLKYRNK